MNVCIKKHLFIRSFTHSLIKLRMGLFDFFSKEKKETLDKGLEKTKTSIFDKISRVIVGKSKVDEEVLDELEEILISSDVGVETTVKIIRRIEARVEQDKYTSVEELDRILREETAELLSENNAQDASNSFETDHLPKPYVLLVVGVNGVGKTTTIGKLAYQFDKRGKKVVLGAADTFRAAAVDQLKLWGQRVGVPVIEHGMNTDPSAVAFDAVKKGMEMGADIIIIDTAGRLHTKVNLMNELGKIKRVVQKFLPDAPHEVMLVLDGSTGQNAVIQAREFTKVTEINSLTITKLDGTAKGGVVIGISDEFKIPVKYIGVGEKIDDLQVFNKMEFVDSLFKK
jgi:fused signal recognition particle receptor